jgi:hypothetical protein
MVGRLVKKLLLFWGVQTFIIGFRNAYQWNHLSQMDRLQLVYVRSNRRTDIFKIVYYKQPRKVAG